MWFLAGDTNVKYLQENGVRIWNEWADENGNLGPIYGKQWRGLPNNDQINNAINLIKKTPWSRRIVVDSWNVEMLEKMKLYPCHALFQFYVANNKLSCQLYQRSADIFLGVPFNIASYALLTHMIAQVCGLEVGEYVHTFGDLHLYHNHFEQAKLQLSRIPRQFPNLKLNPDITDIDDFKYSDIEVLNYDPTPRN